MTDQVRRTYSQELEALKHSTLRMGALAEELIRSSIKALIERDAALAARTVADDEKVDEMEAAINQTCIRLLALQQPMATDLRLIASSMKISSDIERLADHTTKISKKAAILSELPQLKPYVDLPEMAKRVIEMFKLSLDAFINLDPVLALKVIDMDDSIDEYNHRIFTELIELMKRDPSCINYVSHLMVVVQSLERIADHVTNICESTVFIVEGASPKSSWSARS
ncbi:MAG TPA: phosphate signaling complex protein PhoU [bacterium]|nr:phosphate signaling complex protein PhoU [bacterium]